MIEPSSFHGLSEDPVGCFGQGSKFRIRLRLERLAVAVADENGAASGAVPGLDVAEPIADHEALVESDAIAFCRTQQQSRLRFAAVAIVDIVMRTDLDFI